MTFPLAFLCVFWPPDFCAASGASLPRGESLGRTVNSTHSLCSFSRSCALEHDKGAQNSGLCVHTKPLLPRLTTRAIFHLSPFLPAFCRQPSPRRDSPVEGRACGQAQRQEKQPPEPRRWRRRWRRRSWRRKREGRRCRGARALAGDEFGRVAGGGEAARPRRTRHQAPAPRAPPPCPRYEGRQGRRRRGLGRGGRGFGRALPGCSSPVLHLHLLHLLGPLPARGAGRGDAHLSFAGTNVIASFLSFAYCSALLLLLSYLTSLLAKIAGALTKGSFLKTSRSRATRHLLFLSSLHTLHSCCAM